MFAIASIIVAAILAGLENEDERRKYERQLEILGYPLEGLKGTFGDWFVPIRIWDDGGSVWQAILPEAVDFVLSEFGTRAEGLFDEGFESDDAREDLDPETFVRRLDSQSRLRKRARYFSHVESSGELFVYVMHGMPQAAVLVCSDLSSGLEVAAVVRDETSFREIDTYRLGQVVSERGYDPNDAQALRLERYVVPDRVIAAHEALTNALDQDLPIEDLVAEAAQHSQYLADWMVAYKNLRDAAVALDAAVEAFEELDNMYPEEMSEHLGIEEEVGDAIDDFDDWPPDFRDLRSEAIFDAKHRAMEIANRMSNLFVDESYLFANLVLDMDVKHVYEDDGVRIELYPIGSERHDDPTEEIFFYVDEEDAGVSWSLVHGSSGASSERPGLFDADRHSFISESEITAAAGTPKWKFPGSVSGEWELMDLIDRYTLSGKEDGPLFVKIAADHDLLTDAARARWEPVFSRFDSAEDLVTMRYPEKNQ